MTSACTLRGPPPPGPPGKCECSDAHSDLNRAPRALPRASTLDRPGADGSEDVSVRLVRTQRDVWSATPPPHQARRYYLP